jgi:inosine-uridine nucleoside N-ribohydrolase
MFKQFLLLSAVAFSMASYGAEKQTHTTSPGGSTPMNPIPGILFDTDMGNDIDDALAMLMMLRADQQGMAKALMVASCNSNEWAVPGIKAIALGYGFNDLPVSASCDAKGLAMGQYTQKLAEDAGLKPGPAEDSVVLMRKILQAQPAQSVRVVATGFSTNLAGLLASQANHKGDGIQLSGVELVREKVEFLTMMAGNFANPEHGEFNVAENVQAFGKVIQEWPTPIFLSGYEIGEHVLSKAEELRKVLKPENPVWRGYEAFFHEVIKKEPGDRPSWDQTAMLWALEPTAKHFDPSEPLIIHLAEKGQTTTSPGSTNLGDRRILKFAPGKGAEKIGEILAGWYR